MIALYRHAKKDPDLLKRFQAKKSDEKAAYMRKQKQARKEILAVGPANAAYDFSDLKGIQSQVSEAMTDDAGVVNWMPFRKWYIEEIHFQKNLSVQDGLRQFAELIISGQKAGRKIWGQWCFKDFGGGFTHERLTHGTRGELQRSWGT